MRRLLARAAELLPVRVITKFLEHSGGTQATVIAWNALIAIFPIALALAAVGGLLLAAAGISPDEIAGQVVGLFPNDTGAQQAILTGVDSLRRQTGLLAVLALVGFLWTGSGLFGAMEEVFGAVFKTKPRPFVQQKLMAIAMMGLFAVLTLLSVSASALVPLLREIPGVPRWLSGSAAGAAPIAISLLSGFLLFFVIYYVVPNRRQRASRVLPGAIFSAVAFELLSLLWPTYIRLNQGMNRYGSQFAFLFILLAFFYFLGVITVLGADIIAVIDHHPDESETQQRDGSPATAAN